LERRAASCAILCMTVLGACAQDINPRAASQAPTGGAGGAQPPPGVAGQQDGGRPPDAGRRPDAGRPPDAGRRPDAGRPPDAGLRPDAGRARDTGSVPDLGNLNPYGAPCNTPDFVPSMILVPRCGACHNDKSSNLTALNVVTPGVRGRLSGTAYTCNSRRLVVTEPALGGYILDKLNDVPGICGTRMPAVGPALSRDEIECIKTWLQATR
jgi:hypothetical protein